MICKKLVDDCKVSDNVVILANTYVKNLDIPNDSLVFDTSPNQIIKHRPDYMKEHSEGVFNYE